jgi:hypothetical protein
MNQPKLEGRTVYVPAPDSHLRQTIAAGSGIVGTPQDDGRVLIDYEGNLYGAAQLNDYTARVYHAHDRHVWPSGLDPAKPATGYPTVARALVEGSELLEVGSYDPDSRTILVSDAAALVAWTDDVRVIGDQAVDVADLDSENKREIL